MANYRKLSFGILLLIATVSIAYILGVQAGNYVGDKERAETRAKGINQTRQVLAKMGTINIGDKLQNLVLEDIDGNVRRLAELVKERSVISFLRPDCDACLVELEHLHEIAVSPQDWEPFIFISTANPLHLRELEESFHMNSVILFDEEGMATEALNVMAWPFNIVVDGNLTIIDIHARPLDGDEFREVIEFSSLE